MSEVARVYPDKLEVKPLTKPPAATVRVPGSKSITNRALVLAAMTPYCIIEGALRSEDTELMVESLRRLGLDVVPNWDTHTITIDRHDSTDSIYHDDLIPNGQAELFVGNSGTTMRFLTALVSLGEGSYRLDGVPRMRERPINDLIAALRSIDVDVRSENGDGCPPVIINTRGLYGGAVRIRGDVSSQFLSALLLAVPFARGDTVIDVDGEMVSQPYVWMTLAMMRQAGLAVAAEGYRTFRVNGHQFVNVSSIHVEPDASAASYFFATAAITGGEVTVEGLTTKSIQGDIHFVDVLQDMGCTIVRGQTYVSVHGSSLRGIDVDMNAVSDTVMTLAAVACFADGPTTIRNVAHIRHKETDRLAALATELRRVGAEVVEFDDGLTITPRPLHGAEIETYNDHRMAMSMALIGLRVPGIVIKNPGCVAKTYPGFWDDLEKLRQ
jgi:3-phosphoshikimate 1-carboxyvinyltransferase